LIATAANAETVALRGATMGTTYHIKLVAAPGEVGAKSLHEEVEKILAEIDRQMSTYRPDSELSRFNRTAAGEWFPVSAATAEVAAAAQRISEKTSGALDVTVGPLVRLWHFGPKKGDASAGEKSFAPPADHEIAAALENVGYQKLSVRMNPPALRKSIDGLEVDLSSIGSGFAIDRLAELLRKQGIDDFMVEIGGEVRASGRREDGKSWRVGIERPSREGRELQTSLALKNAAIATAGDYRKFFEYGGKRFSHIIDPSTGRPVTQSFASVTVVADTCVEADGWDTPLFVLGPDRGFDCAEENGIAALFIELDAKNAQGRATTAWKTHFDR
jgi:thiamine biosynthesis lipoprotein